ncbi:MAG TPA: phosphatidate cytidylyltransferase [Clostridia bacterium]
MLKIRVISSIIGIAILMLVIYLGNIPLGISITLLSIVGINELYSSFSKGGVNPVRIIGYISCIPVMALSISGEYKRVTSFLGLLKSVNAIALFVYILLAALLIITVLMHGKRNLYDISATMFGILYVPFLFSFIVLVRNMGNGIHYIWLIFIGAFATDTAAYFTGKTFGKTKFLPKVSPNKSIEGAFGGIVGCVVATLIYGYFIGGMPLYHFAILGVLNGIVSQAGDWSASSIKRYMNIKDYGSIMPGHGGVLDRFDSILFVAPLVYFYLEGFSFFK